MKNTLNKRTELIKRYPDMKDTIMKMNDKTIEVAEMVEALTQEEREFFIDEISKKRGLI